MTYAAIMVHVDPAPEAQPALELAASLAAWFGAQLIGVGAECYEAIADAGGVAGEVLLQERLAVEADLPCRRSSGTRFASSSR